MKYTRQTCQHWPGTGPMLYTQSARCWQNILARHWPGIGAILAQCRHFVICRNDAIMCPVYIKQYWLYTGKTASAQYRPITLQYRPNAGPMLYAELARCRQSILARHWHGTVCGAALAQCRHYAIGRKDAGTRPLYKIGTGPMLATVAVIELTMFLVLDAGLKQYYNDFVISISYIGLFNIKHTCTHAYIYVCVCMRYKGICSSSSSGQKSKPRGLPK